MLLGSALSSGCNMLDRPTPINITFNPHTKLVYMGNSAAMMAVIGPEGIAIGTAIDVGIANDVERHLQTQGGSQQVLAECLQQHFPAPSLSSIHIADMNIIPADGGYYLQVSGEVTDHAKSKTFTIGDTSLGRKGNLTNLKEDPRLIQTLIQQTCKGMWEQFSTRKT